MRARANEKLFTSSPHHSTVRCIICGLCRGDKFVRPAAKWDSSLCRPGVGDLDAVGWRVCRGPSGAVVQLWKEQNNYNSQKHAKKMSQTYDRVRRCTSSLSRSGPRRRWRSDTTSCLSVLEKQRRSTDRPRRNWASLRPYPTRPGTCPGRWRFRLVSKWPDTSVRGYFLSRGTVCFFLQRNLWILNTIRHNFWQREYHLTVIFDSNDLLVENPFKYWYSKGVTDEMLKGRYVRCNNRAIVGLRNFVKIDRFRRVKDRNVLKRFVKWPPEANSPWSVVLCREIAMSCFRVCIQCFWWNRNVSSTKTWKIC